MSKKDQSNKFNFFVPATFEKGITGSSQEMRIKGVCSTTSEDTDGETLLPVGFDFAPLLQKGFVNWNHQGSKTASAIIGQVTKGEVINEGQDFYIEGYLYKNSAEARSVYELASILENDSPDRRLGFSIEGQAIEKDPINPKIIRKARITGLAITASPKNPNTLLSIMKGEYSEPFIEDEDEENDEDKKDKSMTAEGAEGVTQKESVEGGQKILDALQSDKISKSEVFSQIIEKFDIYDSELINSVYTLVEKTNDKINMGGELNQDVINKSFELLDQAETALVKADEEVIVKSEEELALEKSNADMEVALGFARENVEKGMDEISSVEDLIRKGCSLVVSQTAVQSAISEYQAVGEGGQIQTLKSDEDELNKSEVNTLSKSEEIDLIKGMIAEQFEKFKLPEPKELPNFSELIKSETEVLGNKIGAQFTALSNLLKSQFEQNSELSKQVEELSKANETLELNFKKIDEAPVQKRSVTSQTQAIERFEKSAPQGAFNANSYNLSKKEDRESLTTRLFDEYSLVKAAGREDMDLYKAITDIEASQTVLPEQQVKLQRMGIELTN